MSLFNRRYGSLVVVLTVIASWPALMTAQQNATRTPSPTQNPVERGKYLVAIQDCNGCHTPFNKDGQPDMTRMLSGHPQDVAVKGAPQVPFAGGWIVGINGTNTAWAGPWGVSFTTNLTPDRLTGIGAWTEPMFINTIRKGVKSSGRPLLPPMPWRAYANMTDDDLKAVFAYLKTIPPISNRVPAALPAAK